MKSLKKVGLVLGAALLVPGMANAGDFVVSGKADFVSDYIWRGLDQNSGCLMVTMRMLIILKEL